MKPKVITIATRESPLAMWQAKYAARMIESQFPDIKTRLLPMTTKGDQILDVTLNKIGGKGLFLKELEQAMLAGEADIAVHSMKDVPADMPDGFSICSVFPRANPSDAFVSNQYNQLSELPKNAVVGTSSLRRQAQLLVLRSDLQIKPLRGNVQTRLQKLDDGLYHAIILATAGLQRMDMDDRVRSELQPVDWLPAVAQGAIGVECLSHRTDLLELFSELNDEETWQCILAERSMNQELNGSCSAAIGGYAFYDNDEIHLYGKVCAHDGTEIISSHKSSKDAVLLGVKVASEMLKAGAQRLLAEADEH